MKFDQLPSALQAWLRTMHERSFSRDAVLRALLDAKYETNYASTVVDCAWNELPAQRPSKSPNAAATAALLAEPGATPGELRPQARPLST
ncbi:MAG: hypothetical protein M3496_14345, partial [Pseudomonadota bacterium]|nr:hypothetical protein [Pseudomonadota bacterium]